MDRRAFLQSLAASIAVAAVVPAPSLAMLEAAADGEIKVGAWYQFVQQIKDGKTVSIIIRNIPSWAADEKAGVLQLDKDSCRSLGGYLRTLAPFFASTVDELPNEYTFSCFFRPAADTAAYLDRVMIVDDSPPSPYYARGMRRVQQ
jgi:hypothetical protein